MKMAILLAASGLVGASAAAAHGQMTSITRTSMLSANTLSDTFTGLGPYSNAVVYPAPPFALPYGQARQTSDITSSTINLDQRVFATGGGSPMQGFYAGTGVATMTVDFTLASNTPFTLDGTLSVQSSPFPPGISGRLIRTDQAATIFDVTAQPFYTPAMGFSLLAAPFSMTGVLPAGTYRFESTLSAQGGSSGTSNTATLVMNLTVPAPAAVAPLFLAGVMAARRHRSR